MRLSPRRRLAKLEMERFSSAQSRMRSGFARANEQKRRYSSDRPCPDERCPLPHDPSFRNTSPRPPSTGSISIGAAGLIPVFFGFGVAAGSIIGFASLLADFSEGGNEVAAAGSLSGASSVAFGKCHEVRLLNHVW